jgi:hypothetical protein
VDKQSFQIIRMQTDLLAPRTDLPEIGLFRLTTKTTFSEVRLQDFPNPLWLPSDAEEYWEAFNRNKYRTYYHFKNYKSYRVSVKVLSAGPWDSVPTDTIPGNPQPSASANDQSYYAEARPYINLPLEQLVKLVPELKKLRPAQNQQMLPTILRETGLRVDDFFRNTVDLVADEYTTEARVNSIGGAIARQHPRDSYLILRHGNEQEAHFSEYRADAKGNGLDQWNPDQGFFVTSGFALSCVHFSRAIQSDSVFSYVGDETIGKRNTYVVAFAQRPGHATLTVAMRGRYGGIVHLLVQGVAWLDKDTFQIVRMRTDLLAPRPEIELYRNTTQVTYKRSAPSRCP